jgi:hypothetical protein
MDGSLLYNLFVLFLGATCAISFIFGILSGNK